MRGFTYLEDESWIESQLRRDRSGLPISLKQAEQVTRWLKRNYGDRIEAATKDTPIPPHVICGIACQETAYFWLRFVDDLEPGVLLGRCVLDASGDHPSSPRSAFPRNTRAFREAYDDAFAEMLIEEANKTRALRDYSPRDWVYKGYGIFQYDLQFVKEDEVYFRERQWYDFDVCLGRVMHELDVTWKRHGELWEAVRAYNGSGSRAQQYKRNVKKFCEVTEEVWASAPGPDKPKPVPVPEPAPEPEPATQEPAVVASGPQEGAGDTVPAAPPAPKPSAIPMPAANSVPASAPQPTPVAAPTAAPAAIPAAAGPKPPVVPAIPIAAVPAAAAAAVTGNGTPEDGEETTETV